MCWDWEIPAEYTQKVGESTPKADSEDAKKVNES